MKISIDDQELAKDSNWNRTEAQEQIWSVLSRYSGQIHWLKLKIKKREGKTTKAAYLCSLRVRTRFSLEVIESSAISAEPAEGTLECVRRSQRTIARRLAFRGVATTTDQTQSESTFSN